MNGMQNVKRRTEYLVVGAGAAGCTLGYLLKKAGQDVLLLEMQDEAVREKLCAGILENRAELAFADIFGLTVEEAGLVTMPIENLYLRNSEGYEMFRGRFGTRTSEEGTEDVEVPKNLGSSIRGFFKSGGKMLAKRILRQGLGFELGSGFTYRVLPRRRFDNYIRDRYLAEGGEILDRTIVRAVDAAKGLAECIDLRTKETFTLQFSQLIGADGAGSAVRRLVTGRKARTALVLEGVVPVTDKGSVIYFENGASGYCWYVPRGEDATIGCGYHNLGEDAGEISRQRLADFCEKTGIAMPDHIRGALLPKGNDVLLHPAENVYLLGDAAGLIDVFTGGGIHYAMLSAQALANSFAGGPSYEEGMKTHLAFIKKNADNVDSFFKIACSFIHMVGHPMNPWNSNR